MRILDEGERDKLRKLIEKKGKRAALLDKSARPLLSEAEKRDVARKGFLQSVADMCVVIMDPKSTYRLTKGDVIECLKGAIDGIEHVG